MNMQKNSQGRTAKWYKELEQLADSVCEEWNNPLTGKIDLSDRIVKLRQHLWNGNVKKK